ncbi:uncharacterized protein LOC143301409 isoform X2 [Babylonia areolata]|uniref:uncharacterized protein LOC143301409 isoform X2 n=1 Tax=Babylonia areolata TaxID=304850 RepID=UPI003FD59941
MAGSGVRMNGVKEKEQRLRRMQIELGRARLVARPLDLLQQPINIVPPSDPDSDPAHLNPDVGDHNPDPGDHNPDPNPDPELTSAVDPAPPGSGQNQKDSGGCGDTEVTDTVPTYLLEDLGPFNTHSHSANPFLDSAASDQTLDQADLSSNPFTDADFSSSDPTRDVHKTELPGSSPLTEVRRSKFSVCSDSGGSGSSAVEDLRFLNPSPLIPTHTSCEDLDNADLLSHTHASTILSPIFEEKSFPSMTSEGCARKDSGYCVTSLESLSSMTSPEGEGSGDFIWKSNSAGITESTSDMARSKMNVAAKEDCSMPGTDYPNPDVQMSNSNNAVKVGSEELISFTDTEKSPADWTQWSGNDDHHQPESLQDKGPDSAGSAPQETKGSEFSKSSQVIMDTGGKLDEEMAMGEVDAGDKLNTEMTLGEVDTGDKLSAEMTGQDSTYLAFSDIDSDFVSSTSGYEVDDDNSDTAASEADAEFQSNAVGLLVEVYGMDSDELCGHDLSLIPEETFSELESMADSDLSADMYSGRQSARRMLKKESNVEMNSFEEQDSGELQDLSSPISDHHGRQTLSDVVSEAGHGLYNMKSSPAVSSSGHREASSKPTPLDLQHVGLVRDNAQPIHFIDNLQFPEPQRIAPADFDHCETDFSLPGDVSDYSLTTCYDSLEPSFDMEDRSKRDVNPEIFEAFAADIINNLMDGSFSLSSMPSMGFEGCATPTQSLSSFERNELICRSPELSQDLDDTLSHVSEEGEEKHPKRTAECEEPVLTPTAGVLPSPYFENLTMSQHTQSSNSEPQNVNVIKSSYFRSDEQISVWSVSVSEEDNVKDRSGDSFGSNFSSSRTLSQKSLSFCDDSLHAVDVSHEEDIHDPTGLETDASDSKVGGGVSDTTTEKFERCQSDVVNKENVHLTVNAPVTMLVSEDTGTFTQEKGPSQLVTDPILTGNLAKDKRLDLFMEMPEVEDRRVIYLDADERMQAIECETDSRKERERLAPQVKAKFFTPSFQNAHHYTNSENRCDLMVSETCPGRGVNAPSVDESEYRFKEKHGTVQTDQTAENFRLSDSGGTAGFFADNESWQGLCELQEVTLENYIVPNVQVKPAQNKPPELTSCVASGLECRDSSTHMIKTSRAHAVCESECSSDRIRESTPEIPVLNLAAEYKERNTTTSDFTTLPKSPILTRIPKSNKTKPVTSSDTTSTSDGDDTPVPEMVTTCSGTGTRGSSQKSARNTNTCCDQAPVSYDQPESGQSNMSYLLNKWHAMEETPQSLLSPRSTSPAPSWQEHEDVRGLRSSRYLSTSTPNLATVHAMHLVDQHPETGTASSREEEAETAQDASCTSTQVLSKAVIYGSTGDLQTSGKPSAKPRVFHSELQPASAATPKSDRYLMSSIEDLNIVLITASDDSAACGDDTRQRSASLSRDTRSPPTSSLTSSEPWFPGPQEARETVAGLPSVMTLIAKFSHVGQDPHTTTSSSTSFATSRKRWSSAPRLQGPESTLSPSSSSSALSSADESRKKRSSSVHYRWDLSTSSWVVSSSSPGRHHHQPVSSCSSQEEEMRQDQRAELQQQEEEEKKEEKRKSYQETTREEQTVDAAVGGAGQREDHAAADRDVVKEAQEPVPQQRQQTPPTQATTTTTTSSEQQWEDEAEEGVYENEPEQRSDVVRESDRNVGAELPSVGTAKSMRDKFVSGQVENAQMESKREATPPAAQVDGGVFENEPQYNPDVVHADDQGQEALPEEGTARNIAARFKEMEKQGSVPVPSPGKREITPDRTGKVEYVSEPRGHVDKYEPEVQAGIFESQPAERDDVVKSDELPEEVLPEKGSAKNIAERFKQLSTDNASSTPRGKREITPDTSGRVEYVSEPTGFVEKYEGHTESGVFESQPADREDVVKADTLPEDIMPEQGMARNIAARFKEMEKTTKSPPSPGKVKEFTPPRENGTGPQSSGVYESTPQVASDVVHADDQPEEVLPEKGMAKSIADRFRQLSSGDNTPTKSPRSKKEFTPPPGGSGVYENTPKQFVPDYNQPPESGILESKPETRSDVVRSDEPVTSEQELPERGYTKNLLSAWRQKESESSKVSPPSSGKPKEFTPPREEPRVTQQRPAPRTPKSPQAGTDMNDGSVHPSDLPGQYQPQAEASVFESEPERREDVVREEDTDWTQGMPKPDTTKKMLAKFKHIQQQAGAATDTPPAKPKPAARKVGRSKSMRVPVQLEKCGACQKTVYAMEKIEIEKHSYHKSCFRCSHCHCILTPKTFAINNNIMFCTNHYKQLFATKGNYDEGFGRDQHKKRWKSEPNLADDEHSSPASAHH